MANLFQAAESFSHAPKKAPLNRLIKAAGVTDRRIRESQLPGLDALRITLLSGPVESQPELGETLKRRFRGLLDRRVGR